MVLNPELELVYLDRFRRAETAEQKEQVLARWFRDAVGGDLVADEVTFYEAPPNETLWNELWSFIDGYSASYWSDTEYTASFHPEELRFVETDYVVVPDDDVADAAGIEGLKCSVREGKTICEVSVKSSFRLEDASELESHGCTAVRLGEDGDTAKYRIVCDAEYDEDAVDQFILDSYFYDRYTMVKDVDSVRERLAGLFGVPEDAVQFSENLDSLERGGGEWRGDVQFRVSFEVPPEKQLHIVSKLLERK